MLSSFSAASCYFLIKSKSNAPYSGFPNHLQTKSNLHISIRQSQIHYIKSIWDTLCIIEYCMREAWTAKIPIQNSWLNLEKKNYIILCKFLVWTLKYWFFFLNGPPKHKEKLSSKNAHNYTRSTIFTLVTRPTSHSAYVAT